MIRPNPPKGRKSQVCRTHSVPLQHLWGCARVRDLTGHVHHPTAAHSQDLVGLAEQPAGADAVSVVPGELLLAAGAAVPPGLGQVGQLSTQRFMRPPERQGPAAAGGRCDGEDLPSAPDTKQRSENPERRRSPTGGCREARPDCGSALGCRLPGMFRLRGEALDTGGVLSRREREREAEKFRCVPPQTAPARLEANAEPCFSHVWKINHGGSLSFDSDGVSTNLILPRNFPFQIKFFVSLCNQKRHYLPYMTRRARCRLYLFLRKPQQRNCLL